jgi:hypothetical protein
VEGKNQIAFNKMYNVDYLNAEKALPCGPILVRPAGQWFEGFNMLF